MGAYDADMDCDPSQTYLYPQFYAFSLFASPSYLNLQAGGHMAVSVSPASTTSGLSATAFYTSAADDVVIINPTSTSYSSVNVTLANPGLTSATGTMYLLNSTNADIASQSVSLSSVSGGYSTTIAVPALSTVAISLRGTGQQGATSPVTPTAPVSAPSAIVSVTPTAGSLVVAIDSSKSTGGGSAIVGRTISFGDGTWLNWTPTTTHNYAKAGIYTVVLTIKNQVGQIASASSIVTVN
jgi:PKD repeat protein